MVFQTSVALHQTGATAADSQDVTLTVPSIDIGSVVVVDKVQIEDATETTQVAEASVSDIQTPEFGLGDESKKTTVEQVEDDIEYTSIVVGGVAMVTAFFGGVFGGGAFLKRGNMVIRHLDALEAKERRLAEGGYRHPEMQPGDEDIDAVLGRIETTRALWRQAQAKREVEGV
uniref:Uncharacterized protein n=1 Tax=Florenciella parvula TaxID=236787 RepID=A0A7S2CXD3_9STRA